MTGDQPKSDRLAELRRRAEAKLEPETLDVPDMSPDEIRNLIHELRTHHVELELQNDELRRSEELLIESRDRLVDLYDFAPVGYVTVSDNGLTLEANLTLANMLGVERGTLLKQRLSAFIVPDDEDILYLHHQELLNTKQRRTCQLRMVRKDAEPLWVEMDSKLTDADHESDVRYRTAISDITERKKVQDALTESERYHRSLLHSMREDVIVLDRNYRITDLNNRVSATVGLNRDQMLGRTCFEVFRDYSTPCDSRGEQCGLHQVFSNGQTMNCRHRYVHADGSARDVDALLSPVNNAQGSVTHVIMSLRDVSDLCETQRQLKASEEKHRILFESSRDAIMTLAPPSWNFTSGNPACVAMFGVRDEAEFTSHSPWALSPEHQPDGQRSAEKTKEMLATAMREGTNFFEWTYQRIDGTEFPASVLLTRMEVAGLVLLQATVRDLTQQKVMEREFRHTQKMKAVGQLAAGVAHEFNNLLFGILGSVERITIKHGGTIPESLEKPLGDIRKCGHRGAALTKQLLAFARKTVPTISTLDVDDTISSLESMLRNVGGDQIKLELLLARNLPTMTADRAEVEQAILNLARNACDAMPKGGTLTIRTAVENLDELRVSANPDAHPGPYVLLSMADTGCGMSPDTLERIFEPFFTTKPVGKGTGLGLSTVFADVSKNGGIIEVDSSENEGTEFRVYLPVADETIDAGEDGAAPTGKQYAGGTETIMLVDDNEVVLNSGAYLLEARGYNVISALGSHEALAAAASHDGTIDLLLTDVSMPDMNGWDLARRLTSERPEMKVIFMSGYASDVLDAGATDCEHIEFVEKPPKGDTLFQRIRDVLDASRKLAPRDARILVVDDEEVVRIAFRERLESDGYEVVEAANGREAMQRLDDGGIDIVITDILMPEKDGLETLQHVKRTQPTVPVIAMTGAASDLHMDNARGLGASRVFAKPVKLEEITAAVKELLSS